MKQMRALLEENGFVTFAVGAMFGVLFTRRRNHHHYHHKEDERENYYVPHHYRYHHPHDDPYYYRYRPHQGSENKTVSNSSPGLKKPATATAANMEAN